MSKLSEDFIKEIKIKLKKAVKGEPGQDQGLFIYGDNQDRGSLGLELYAASAGRANKSWEEKKTI